MSIKFVEAAEFFKGLPHQIDAFNWLQDQVSSSVLETFASMYRKNQHSMYLQKAIEHFSDTLCEFAHELSAEQFYKAFLIAATNVAKSAQDDYLKCKALVDLIEGNEETKASQLSELDMPQVRRKARCLV